MIHVRNQADIDSLPTRTTDDITVHLGGDVVLPLLEEGGTICAPAATSVSMPLLEESGHIGARAVTSVSMPMLEECWDIYAPAATSVSMPRLKESGDIYAHAATSLSFPLLEECGNIYAPAATSVSMPSLKASGDIDSPAATSVSMPRLKESGDIYAHAATSLSFPLLEECGYIHAPAATSCNIRGVDMNTPDQERAALARVAPIILADDGRWDQSTYGPDQCPTPECGTPMCLAGWLRAMGRPEVRRLRVQVAGMLEAPGAYRAGAFGSEAHELVRRLCREAIGA